MFYEKFSGPARRTMQLANTKAHERGSTWLEPELYVRALLEQADGVASEFFETKSVDREDIRSRLDQQSKSNPPHPDTMKIPNSPAAKHILESAMQLSEELGHPRVDTGRLLFGLLSDSDGMPAQLFQGHGITSEAVKEFVVAHHTEHGDAEPLELPKR